MLQRYLDELTISGKGWVMSSYYATTLWETYPKQKGLDHKRLYIKKIKKDRSSANGGGSIRNVFCNYNGCRSYQ